MNCTATDAANNTTSGSFAVTVVDTTAPALDLPDDITTPATEGDNADVTYTATATDIVDGTVTVNCTPPSGSTFSVGPATTVNCSATDAAGNTATGSFTVTVVGDEWLAPGCYAAPGGAPFSVFYVDPENIVGNTRVHSTSDCTGTYVEYTVVRAVPNTPEQAALQCAGLLPGSTTFEADSGGLAFPADAWVCVAPPPATLYLPDDFRVGATGPDGAVVNYPFSFSPAGSGSCGPGQPLSPGSDACDLRRRLRERRGPLG